MLASASGNYASRLFRAAPTGIQPVGRAGAVKTTASVFPDDGNRRGESRLPVRDVRDDEEEEEVEEEEKEEKGEEEEEEQEEEGEKHEDEDKDAQESEYYSMSASVRRKIKQMMRPGCKLFSRSTICRSLVNPLLARTRTLP